MAYNEDILRVTEFKGKKLVEKEYSLRKNGEKKGLSTCDEYPSEVLPCVFDDINSGVTMADPFPSEAPGVKAKRDGLQGYYYQEKQILPNDYDEIDLIFESSLLEDGIIPPLRFRVKRQGLFGELLYDFNTESLSEIIPIKYSEIIYGSSSLIACYYKTHWDLFCYDDTDAYKPYYAVGAYPTIANVDEPYPYVDDKILFLKKPIHHIISWLYVERCNEIRERKQYVNGPTRTIIQIGEKQGLWNNGTRSLLLDLDYDLIESIKVCDKNNEEDRSVYKVKTNGKYGIFDAKNKRFLLNCVFDSIKPIRKDNQIVGPIDCYLVSLENKTGVIESSGSFLLAAKYDRIEFIYQHHTEFDGIDKAGYDEMIILAEKDKQYEAFYGSGKRIMGGTFDRIDFIKTRYHQRPHYYFGSETYLIRVRKDKKVGLFDDDGFELFPCEYDAIAYVPEMDIIITLRDCSYTITPFFEVNSIKKGIIRR